MEFRAHAAIIRDTSGSKLGKRGEALSFFQLIGGCQVTLAFSRAFFLEAAHWAARRVRSRLTHSETAHRSVPTSRAWEGTAEMSGAGCLGHFAQAAPGLRGKRRNPWGTCSLRRARPRPALAPRRFCELAEPRAITEPTRGQATRQVLRRRQESRREGPGEAGRTGRTAGKRRSKTRAILDAALGRPDGSGEWDGDDATAPGVINAIVTDVDGTLLNSSQELTMRTEVAIARAPRAAYPSSSPPANPAGRGRAASAQAPGPDARSVHPRLADVRRRRYRPRVHRARTRRGVGRGRIREANGASRRVLRLCILCEARDENTDLVLAYGEPTPEAVGTFARTWWTPGSP